MVFKESHNPQVWKFLPARRIKGVYQILQIQEKSGFIHINFSEQSAWPLTLAWLQLRLWWLMESSAFLLFCLRVGKKLQIIRNCDKPGALCAFLLE
jgi:hypothetical protein